MPALDPAALAQMELLNKSILPIIRKFSNKYSDEYDRINTPEFLDEFNVENITQDVRANLAKYLDSIVGQDMASSKYKAMAYAENQRDGALLNYRDRYGFDNILTASAPYQFCIHVAHELDRTHGRQTTMVFNVCEIETFTGKK